ncbi:hypothetical protein LWH94_04470 [Marinobacter sp. G11]|jgi:hypothetical protein|nr:MULTISPECIES: hypothetical protein [unclassified Marinobacter]MCE0758455.1 hypothetical protein [Marinobacter sp. G11]
MQNPKNDNGPIVAILFHPKIKVMGRGFAFPCERIGSDPGPNFGPVFQEWREVSGFFKLPDRPLDLLGVSFQLQCPEFFKGGLKNIVEIG